MKKLGSYMLNSIGLLLVPATATEAAEPIKPPPPPLIAGTEHVTLYDDRYVLGFKFYRLDERTWYVRFESQETSSHMDPRKRPHAVISTDHGRTWKQTDLLAENPQYRSSPTRLVNVTNYSYRYDDRARRPFYEAQGLEVRDTPDGRIAYSKGAYVAISNDNGATWTKRDLDFPGRALLAGYRDDRAYLRLDARTIVRAFYGKPVARLRYYEAWYARSEDDGETWSVGTIAADVETDDSHGETALALAGDNDIVAMMRSEPAPGSNMWVSRSSDRGKTWSKAVKTPLHGHPAHLLLLKDGRLLCTYGMRDQPVGIRFCISDDHGRTWRAEDVRVLRTGADFYRDSGYPITRQADDGTMLTVYYLTRGAGGQKSSVELTRWRLPAK